MIKKCQYRNQGSSVHLATSRTPSFPSSMSSRRRSARISRQTVTTPNVRQIKFPPRSRSVKSGRPSTRRSLGKQDTLTQIGWVPSPSIRDDDDQIREEQPEDGFPSSDAKPGKRKRLKQKSTLTQMDYLIHSRDHEIDDLLTYDIKDKENFEVRASPAKRRKTHSVEKSGHDDAEDNLKASMSPRKSHQGRRKRKSNGKFVEASKDTTRSSKVKDPSSNLPPYDLTPQYLVAQEKMLKKENASQMNASEEAPPLESYMSSQALMPPSPTTPRNKRLREIPSSQSPAATPLSVRSVRLTRKMQLRSPLQERSLNASVPLLSTLERKKPTRKLKIADSVDSESQISLLSPDRTRSQIVTSNCTQAEATVRSSRKDVEKPRSSQMGKGNVNSSPERMIVHQVEDSDEDPEEDAVTPVPKYKTASITPSNLYVSTQNPLNPSPTPSPTKLPSSAQSAGPPRIQNLIANISTMPTRAISTLQVPSSPPLFTQQQTPFLEREIPASSQIQSSARNDQRLDSQEATAQLLSDLAHHTLSNANGDNSAGALQMQTESQAEAAWRVFSSPPGAATEGNIDDNGGRGDLSLGGTCSVQETVDVPSSQPPPPPPAAQHSLKKEESETVHVPSSQPLPLPLTAAPSSSKHKTTPRPSTDTRPSASQATTADVTQTQPQFSPRSLPPLPNSSSPLMTVRKSPLQSETWHWSGGRNRLTESQLLPESLLMDSLRGPPVVEASWRGEEEGVVDEEEEEVEEV